MVLVWHTRGAPCGPRTWSRPGSSAGSSCLLLILQKAVMSAQMSSTLRFIGLQTSMHFCTSLDLVYSILFSCPRGRRQSGRRPDICHRGVKGFDVCVFHLQSCCGYQGAKEERCTSSSLPGLAGIASKRDDDSECQILIVGSNYGQVDTLLKLLLDSPAGEEQMQFEGGPG